MCAMTKIVITGLSIPTSGVLPRCQCRLRGRVVVFVSHRENRVYLAQCNRECSSDTGADQHQGRSPCFTLMQPYLRLHRAAGFGGWPTHFSSFLPSFHLISLHLASYLCLLLPPPVFSFSFFFPNSSSFCCMPRCTNHSVCVSVCVCVTSIAPG